MKLTFLSQNRCKQLRSHRSIEPEFCTISRVPFRWCSLYGFNRYRAAAALTAATPIAAIDTSVTATATIATALTIITPSDSCCCCYYCCCCCSISTAAITMLLPLLLILLLLLLLLTITATTGIATTTATAVTYRHCCFTVSSHLIPGSPAPGPWTIMGPWPTGKQFTQHS